VRTGALGPGLNPPPRPRVLPEARHPGPHRCDTYRREKAVGGKQRVWSKYRICAGPIAMEYFIEHTFEPAKNCMTFHLDYDRLSEFSDTVGYWWAGHPVSSALHGRWWGQLWRVRRGSRNAALPKATASIATACFCR
jgi:hypothetical protein